MYVVYYKLTADAIKSRLVCIYTICQNSLVSFDWHPGISSIQLHKFRDGLVRFRNSKMEGLPTILSYVITKPTYKSILRRLDKTGWFSAISVKGDNFCNFLFAFLHTKPPSEKRSTLKGRHLLPRSKCFPFYSRSFFRTKENNLAELPPLNVY